MRYGSQKVSMTYAQRCPPRTWPAESVRNGRGSVLRSRRQRHTTRANMPRRQDTVYLIPKQNSNINEFYDCFGFFFLLCSVIAVDVDSEKIKIARRNAAIYGVAHKIDFRIGDSFVVLSGVSADVVVTSPPWGGSYNVQNVCSREEGGMAGVLKMAHRIAPRVVLRLPKTIDRTQCLNVSRAADFGRVEFECVTIDECPDSVTVYLKSRPVNTAYRRSICLKCLLLPQSVYIHN